MANPYREMGVTPPREAARPVVLAPDSESDDDVGGVVRLTAADEGASSPIPRLGLTLLASLGALALGWLAR